MGASKDVADQAQAIYMKLAEVTIEQTNETMKAAAASKQHQSDLQSEIAAIDSAEASGADYANSTLDDRESRDPRVGRESEGDGHDKSRERRAQRSEGSSRSESDQRTRTCEREEDS
jgi:hypothetical protein